MLPCEQGLLLLHLSAGRHEVLIRPVSVFLMPETGLLLVIHSCLANSRCWALSHNVNFSKPLNASKSQQNTQVNIYILKYLNSTKF